MLPPHAGHPASLCLVSSPFGHRVALPSPLSRSECAAIQNTTGWVTAAVETDFIIVLEARIQDQGVGRFGFS